MLDVQISIASGVRHILNVEAPLTVNEIRKRIGETAELTYYGLEEDFYVVHNGLLVQGTDVCVNGNVTLFPRLYGGKGGFGSMLRAIGAQIEKTTNREACRDLSGRRLRDINEEKRLKAWIERKGKREEEAAERKKKKLERLCAQPKHEFRDQCYERERSVLTERVGDAVEQGFKAATTSGTKRKFEEDVVKHTKRKTLLDLDIDSDELDSSDDSDGGGHVTKKSGGNNERVSNDSGHSSDESGRSSKGPNTIESEYSEASSDNHNNDDNSKGKNTVADGTPARAEESSESSSATPKDECIEQTVQDK